MFILNRIPENKDHFNFNRILNILLLSSFYLVKGVYYMNKSSLLLIFTIGFSPILGADLTVKNNNSTAVSALDQLIIQARSVKFNKSSPLIGDAYCFFNGENIQNARDIHYALRFNERKDSIEILYGLYLALQQFLLPEGQGFPPEGLNGGFTKDNFEFLKKVFSEIA